MYNWNTDEKKFKKADPLGYRRWRLIQLINYGLDGEKLDRQEVIKHWPRIQDHLYPGSKKTLQFFLWHQKWQPEPGLRPDRNNFLVWSQQKKISANRST